MYYWNGTVWEAVAPVVPQSPIAYQASEPSSPSTGDLWIDSAQDLDSYQRQLVRYRFNPAGGATSVSGVDANGATLSYTPGAEQVYLNGALLVRGSDYVATDGTSVTSLAALSSGDVLEVFAYVAFNPANTYTQSQVDGLVAPMGLVHLNTTSFSAVASQSINNVFSTTYKTYKILIDYIPSTSLTFNMRYRVGGADDTTNNYTRLQLFADGSSVLTNRTPLSTSLTIEGSTTTNRRLFEITLVNPASASLNTGGFSLAAIEYNSNTGVFILNQAYSFNATTAFDGFSIFTSTGSITGSVSTYALKE